MLNAQQVGEALAKLRAQAAAREDCLLVDLVDFLHSVIFQPAEPLAADEVPPADEPTGAEPGTIPPPEDFTITDGEPPVEAGEAGEVPPEPPAEPLE